MNTYKGHNFYLTLAVIVPIIFIVWMMLLVPETNTKSKTVLDIDSLAREFPTATSTSKERQDFDIKIRGLAKEANVLEIKNCQPNPQILHVKLHKSFKVKNLDDLSRTITHLPEVTVIVPGGQEREITADFSNVGIAGFRCDGNRVGIWYISE